jgi:hypothetical protein
MFMIAMRHTVSGTPARDNRFSTKAGMTARPPLVGEPTTLARVLRSGG